MQFKSHVLGGISSVSFRTRALSCAALAIALLGHVCAASADALADGQRQTAKRLVAQGLYRDAVPHYRAALALDDPRDPLGDPRDPLGDPRDPLGDPRDPLGDPRDPLGDPRDPLGECEDLNGLTDCANFACDAPAALHDAYAARRIEAALPGHDPNADLARCRTLRLLGEIAYDANNSKEAAAHYQAALSFASGGSSRTEKAWILGDLGDLASNDGDTSGADTHLQDALQIALTVKDARLEASIRSRIASNLIWANKYAAAVSASRQALDGSRSCGDRWTEAAALNALCLALDYDGRYPEALTAGQEGLRVARAIGDLRTQENLLQSCGNADFRLAQSDDARRFYAQALHIATEIHDEQGQCAVSSDLGNVAAQVSDFGTAVLNYRHAVKIAAKITDETDQGIGLSQLCTAYTEVGQYGLALDSGLQALNILKRVDDEGDLSVCWQHLGRAYRKRGQYSDALACYQEALAWAQKSQSVSAASAALGSMGETEWLLKRYPEAETALTQSRTLARRIGEVDTAQWATYNLGNVALDQNEYDQAVPLFESALASGSLTHERRLQAYANSRLMAAAREQKQTSLAIWYGKRAVNGFQSIRTGLRVLDRSAQRSFIQSKSDIYRSLADLLISAGRIAEAEQVLEMLKEEEYFDFVGQKRDAAPQADARAEFTPDERRWLAEYDSLGETVEQARQDAASYSNFEHLTPAQQTLYDAATKKSDAADDAYHQFRDNLVHRFDQDDQAAGQAVVTAIKNNDAVKSTLRELSGRGERVVELYTVEADNQYDVILQTPDISRWGAYPITASDLNAKVEQYREAIRDPSVDPRPLGEELYRILVGPVESELAGYKPTVVMWSLDGPLGLVAVNALWDGRQYLVQRWENTRFNPAATGNLVSADPSPSAWKNALGFGVSKAITVGGDVFPELAGVPVELSAVIHDPAHGESAAGVLQGRFYLDGEFDPKDALRWLSAGTHPIVHVASHFKLSAAGMDDSYLLCGSGERLTLAQIDQANQIFANVDLLTLSACSTAVSTRGIGADRNSLDSLNELAERQGARSVIATLWDVADASTALLMRDFYRALVSDPAATKIRALQSAQIALLTGRAEPSGAMLRADRSAQARASLAFRSARKPAPALPAYVPDPKRPYAHPYYWAPFVLLGNWK